MSQCNDVIKHLKRGRAITAIQALKLYGIFRLAARVKNLRDNGHDIISTPVHRGNKRFSSYSLGVKK